MTHTNINQLIIYIMYICISRLIQRKAEHMLQNAFGGPYVHLQDADVVVVIEVCRGRRRRQHGRARWVEGAHSVMSHTVLQ